MLGKVVVQLADHLVGRAAELDRLDVKLQELEDGEPGVVELVGAPGIGKSRLLGALAERAVARRILVLSGRGAEQERDLPFWQLEDDVAALLEGSLAEVARGRAVLRTRSGARREEKRREGKRESDGRQASNQCPSPVALMRGGLSGKRPMRKGYLSA